MLSKHDESTEVDRSIVRLCHTGHGFLKFSLKLLNSDRKICGIVM